MPESKQCYSCKFFYGHSACKAFIDGIPEEILTGEIEHSKPIKGQGNSIVYEPKPKGFILEPEGI
jgi:hypothetical protein